MPVAYNGNRILECSVTFAYDRYFFGAFDSRSRKGIGLMNDFSIATPITTGLDLTNNDSVEDEIIGDFPVTPASTNIAQGFNPEESVRFNA